MKYSDLNQAENLIKNEMWRVVPRHRKLNKFLHEFLLGNENMETHPTVLHTRFQNLQAINSRERFKQEAQILLREQDVSLTHSSHQTRVLQRPDSKDLVILACIVLIQCQGVTDTQTDM